MKIFILSISFLFCFHFSIAQWVHMNPGTTNVISDVSFVSDQIGYAVDEQTGRLWKTTDGAANWNLINTAAGVWRIVFLTEDTAVSVSMTGLIKTTDGGITWHQATVPSNAGWWSRPVFFNHKSGITVQQNATSDTMIVMKTYDGGETWQTIMERQDSLGAYINEITFPDSMTGYLTSESGLMYKTTDGGYTWTAIQYRYPGYGSICFTTPDTGFTYVDLEQFYRTYDGGQTWDSFPLPTSPYNGQVRFLNSNVGYICGGNGFNSGFVMETITGGSTWTLDHGDNNTYFAFSFPGSNVGYACGDGGSVIKKSVLENVESENSKTQFLSISPNPFQTTIKLHVKQGPFQNNLSCFNYLGEVIFHKSIFSNDEEIDLSHLAPGVYTLLIQEEEHLETIRIVKAQ